MTEANHLAPKDLAPWVADILDGVARASGANGEALDDEQVRAALLDALKDAPRAVTLEELTRGCAIATELMRAEVVELSVSVHGKSAETCPSYTHF
jgi:hypothetical protein